MEHNWWGSHNDAVVGAISGVAFGLVKFLDIYLLADPYMIVLIKVFITAVVGGLGGVAGKHLFSYLKKKWTDYKNKKR